MTEGRIISGAYGMRGRMNKLILITLAMFIFGCLPSQKTRFAAVTKPGIITLNKRPGQKHIYAISIHCSGRIDGKAKLSLMLNGKPYKTEEISDKVKFSWGGDWYSDSAEIRYEPVNVSSGELIFSYKFVD